MLRIFRILRILRLLKGAKGLRDLLMTMVRTTQEMECVESGGEGRRVVGEMGGRRD